VSLRSEAASQADAMLAVLDRDHPGARIRLGADALGELDRWPDLRVLLVPDEAARQGCSVAGGYRHATRPPTLLVAASTAAGGGRSPPFTSSATICNETTWR
jgi:hypothetical protein